MKKIFIGVVAIIAVIALLVAIYAVSNNQTNSFGSSDADFNQIGYLTSLSTSTGSYCATCPVKLLDLNSGRRYAIIQNNSDTDVYLYFTNETLTVDGLGGTTATSTITSLNGIRLAPNDSDNLDDTYVIGPDNMIYGNIWATSTAISKEISVNYYEY